MSIWQSTSRGSALILRLPSSCLCGGYATMMRLSQVSHLCSRQPLHCHDSGMAETSSSSTTQPARQLWGMPTWGRDKSPLDSTDLQTGQSTVLSFCGGGVYFWWQLGVAKFLRERYDLSKTHMLGASGGAIAATLTACEIPAEQALQSAMRLAKERNLLDKPLGLVGVWGKQVRDWLHDVLPQEAADICRERVKLLVTEIPFFKQLPIGGFACRNELINVNMASAHVPILLDGKLFTSLRGKLVFDGGMQDWLFRSRSKAIAVAGAIMIDHHADDNLGSKRMDMKKPMSFDEVARLIDVGYDYGRRQELDGAYERLQPLRPVATDATSSESDSDRLVS